MGGSLTTIPARVTVDELARVLGRDAEELQAVLQAKLEPHAPHDYLSSELAVAVAEQLGERVQVEPRDLALETLYELETKGEAETAHLTGRAERLVRGVTENGERLDAEIEKASDHWSVARMPIIDRSILRLALYELESEPDVPTAVVVSEGVRLAKMYSTERSGSFVNGVLAALARAVR